MLKTTHSEEMLSAKNVSEMGLFSKEIEIYRDIIPKFTKLYADKGVFINFAPKMYTLSRNPGVENVVLEDLKPKGFVNADRLKGLDQEHVESVLKLMAKYHAASAVSFENNGPYPESFTAGIYTPIMRNIFEEFSISLKSVLDEVLREKYENGEYFAKKVIRTVDDFVDKLMDAGKVDYNSFNVLNHGDCWCNNIMFKYNSDGKLEDTLFVDYQVPKYGPPAFDLYYFILSSARFDIKLEKFDYFIKFYHDNLVENLKLLEYPKEIPSLKDIHILLLKYGVLAKMTTTGVMGAVLLDPTENANMDNFVKNDEEGRKFKKMMYSNPRYMKTMQQILIWMDNKGILD